MDRRGLREQVFKLLFRIEFNDVSEMPAQAEMYFTDGDITILEKDQKYILDKVMGIANKLPEIDQALQDHSEKWDIQRIGKVELTLLRLGVYEILYDRDVPAGVAINEAVELAKKFGQDGSSAFINGMLSKFVPTE